MSEGGAGDGGGGYPGGSTPSSTVPDHQDDGKSGLPPFSSFGEMDGAARVPNTDGEALQSSRLLDISSWDYYGEGLTGRLLDRGDGFPMLVPQPQYRPWESKDHPDYIGPPANKLPSFQSQFTAFPQEQNGETVLTTLTPAPASPNSSASGLPSFHTLSTVPPRGYPLVPAPVQAREIPSIQQQILDERHIHLFQGAPHQQYHQLGGYQPQQQTTLLTVVKTEPLIVTQLPTGYEHHELKMEESQSPRAGYLDSRKKERRKIRASSMESSNESDGVGSSSVESSGQVAAISSTAGFKSPLGPCHQNPSVHSEDDVHEMSDKPVKKKRKRCGECIGCQRKDNCGDCAPCRNDKSHQICKMRRCEKLTEKKHLLYLNHDYPRGERGRGRGKGRGGGSYRKVNQTPRSPLPSPNLQLNGAVDSNMMTNIPDHSATIRGEVKVEPQVTQSGLPPITATTMPLYSSTVQSNVESNFGPPLREPRFTNSAVWQPAPADPNGTWAPQGQFIQQLPPPQIEEIRYPQYTVAGYPQATPGYQQNTFMQTNGTVFNNNATPQQQQQQQHPQPSPHSLHNGNARSTPTLNGNIEYVDQSPRPTEYMNGGSYQQQGQDVMAPPTSSTPVSRCSSAALEGNDQQPGKYTNPPTPTTPSNNQGNAMPGYPLQMPPQSVQSLHNSSGYPGQENVAKSGKNGENKHHQQSQHNAEEKWKRENLKESRGSSKVRDERQGAHSPWPGSSKEQENSWRQRHTPHQEIWPPTEHSPTTVHHPPPPNNLDWGKPPTPGGSAASSIPPWAVTHQAPPPPPVDDPRTRLWNPNGGPPHLMQNSPPPPSPAPQQSQTIHPHQQYQHHQLQSLDVKPEQSRPRGQQQHPPPQQDVWTGAVPPPRPQSNGHSDWPNDPPGQWPSDKKNQYPERAELNSRLKTMILNKQQQEVKKNDNGQQGYPDQKSPLPPSGNFLAQGHHPQELASEDGGSWGENPSNNKKAKNPVEFGPKMLESATSAVLLPSYPPQHHDRSSAPGFLPVSHHPHHYQPPPPPFLGTHHPGFYHHSPYMHGVPLPHPPTQSQALPPPPQPPPPHLSHHNWMHDYRIPPPPHASHHAHPPPVKDQFWYPPAPWAAPGCHDTTTDPHQTPSQPPATPPTSLPNNTPVQHTKQLEDKPPSKTAVKHKETTVKNDQPAHKDDAQVNTDKTNESWCFEKSATKTLTNDTGTQAFDGKDEDLLSEDKDLKKELDSGVESRKPASLSPKEYMDHLEKMKHNARTEIPSCQCFAPDQTPPEPGPYYTHLGYASTLDELRSNSEARTGYKGKAIRMEKILYTGKEGKTTVGCPLAKWIIRRENLEEKLLFVVKNRKGHKCATAWIVVAVVAWEGVSATDADDIYSMLTHKLNKYGLATTRRCATNEPRSCACQGLDPETCGASFSFGCSWSMYYNGCKFARSKDVRKFKLSVRSQEDEVEDKMQLLATQLAPLYEKVAPDSYENQIEFEKEALDCRLGLAPGRPFSGVTACVDFCAHSHRDLHNMNNGCTVVVTLTKHRSLSKPADEQLHVLPLYIMDDTDEHGSKEGQLEKVKSGALENLTKFPCEVRVRAVPLTPCRRHGKKRKDDDEHHIAMPSPQGQSKQHVQDARGQTPDFLQSSQISSTVVDSSPINSFAGWHHSNHAYRCTTPAQPESPRGQQGIINSPDSGMKWRGDMSPLSQHSFCEGELKIDPDSTTSNNQMPPHWNSHKLYASHNMPPNHFRYFPTNQGDPSGHAPHLQPDNQAFRRPKGRPPSRSSNPATPQPVDSTFLKPRPPSDFKSDRSTSPMMSDLSQNTPSSWNASPLYPQYPAGSYQPDIHARGSAYGQSSHIDAANPFSDGHNSRQNEFEGPSGFRKVERSPTSVPSSPQNSKDDSRHYFNFNHSDDPFVHNPHYQSSWGGAPAAEPPPIVKQEYAATGSPCYPRPIKQEPQDPRDHVKTPHPPTPQPQPTYGHHVAHPQSPHPTQQDSFSPWNCDNTSSSLPHESPMMKNWPGPPPPPTNQQLHSPHPPPHQPMAMKPSVHPGFYGGQGAPEANKQWGGDYPFQPWHPAQGGPMMPSAPEPPKPEPLGQVTDYIDNEECFKDSQMGGVAIALSHGSVLFECAKHELHATTALHSPNRKLPSRISLIFYQHRNLIRPHHGSVEWSEKMRLKEAQKLGAAVKAHHQQQQQQQQQPGTAPQSPRSQQPPTTNSTPSQTPPLVVKSPTYTTTTWTTLFPMHPCVVTGPYQESETLG